MLDDTPFVETQNTYSLEQYSADPLLHAAQLCFGHTYLV